MAAWLSNCYWWARWQQFRHGGAIISVRSQRLHAWWRHHFWTPDLQTFYEYVPRSAWRAELYAAVNSPELCPALLFRGHVRVRDRAVLERWIRGLK